MADVGHHWVRHQAEKQEHLHRKPRQGRLMRIGLNSRGQACAHWYPKAAVCHADVLLGLSWRARVRLQMLQMLQSALLRGLRWPTI